MSAAADAFQRADGGGWLVRWPVCLALVLGLHAAVVVPVLRRAAPDEPFAAPPEAIMVDLAPAPTAEEAPPEAPPAGEGPPASPEAPPSEAPPPRPESVAEAFPEPPIEQPAEPEQRPEPPPPEPPAAVAEAVAEAVLPQPPPPPPQAPEPARRPPPQPRPVVARPNAQRPAVEDQRLAAGSEARPVPAASAAPAAAASAPPSSAVPAWQGQLLGRLQRFKRYPELARSRREEGVVHLTFAMDRGGRVVGASISKGSGFPELDAETLALVRRAEPLPAPPPEVPGDPLTLTVPVRFSLRQ